MKFEIDACSPVIGDLLYELEVASWLKLSDQVARRIYSSLKSSPDVKIRLSNKLRVLLKALNRELPIDVDDFYKNKHVNSDLLSVNFTDLTDDEFYQALCEANKVLLTNYYDALKKRALSKELDLYANRDVAFRGFRAT